MLIESIFFHLMEILMHEAATDKRFVHANQNVKDQRGNVHMELSVSISREVVSCFLLLFFTLLHYKTEGCPSEKHNAAVILAALAAHYE